MRSTCLAGLAEAVMEENVPLDDRRSQTNLKVLLPYVSCKYILIKDTIVN